MKQYIRTHIRLLLISWRTFIVYRGNFYTSVFSSLLWAVFSFVTVLLMTARVTSVAGWKPEEIVLMTTVYGIFIGIFHVFFSQNFEHFVRLSDKAELDMYLLKPIDTQYLLSFWSFNIPGITRIVMGIFLTALFIQKAHFSVSGTQVIISVALLSIGGVMVYSVWFLCATLTLWFPKLTNIIDFLYSGTNLSRFPKDMYDQGLREFSYVLLPVGLIIATPVKVLTGSIPYEYIVLLSIFSICFFVCSRLFWRFALKYYTSSGS